MRIGILTVGALVFIWFLGVNLYISTVIQEDLSFEDGILVLPDRNDRENQVFWVSGEWNFYPHVFLNTSDLFSHIPHPLSITQGWNHVHTPDGPLGPYGWGTYHLQATFPEPGRYALMVPLAQTSYRLYKGDMLLESVGTVGQTPGDHTPAYRPVNIMFSADEDPVDIIIHASNFNHYKGGLVQPLMIGAQRHVTSLFTLQNASSTFIIGGMILSAAIVLMLFSYPYRERQLLYIACLALLLALRTSVGSSLVMYRMFPAFPWELGIRFEYIPLPLAAFSYIGFFRHSYKREFNTPWIILLQWAAALSAVLTLVSPVRYFQYLLGLNFGIISVTIIHWGVSVVLHHLWRKRENRLVITGAVLFSICTMADILIYIGAVPYSFPIEFSSLGLLAFIYLQIYIYTGHFLQTLAYSRELTERLEKRVEERTGELAKANEKLYQMAVKDELTGLWNRTELQKRSEEESYRHNRYQENTSPHFSILYIDLDNFKYFNDTYTHEAGDIILQYFSELLDASSRKSDTIFRIGGDEFLMFLPKTDAPSAALISRRIIQAVKAGEKTIESIISGHLRRTITIPPAKQLTCSIGIAAHQGENLHIERLIQYADAALLQAKLSGKDQYHIYRKDDLEANW